MKELGFTMGQRNRVVKWQKSRQAESAAGGQLPTLDYSLPSTRKLIRQRNMISASCPRCAAHHPPRRIRQRAPPHRGVLTRGAAGAVEGPIVVRNAVGGHMKYPMKLGEPGEFQRTVRRQPHCGCVL